MELIELLKIINDQSSQGDTQAQIDTLTEMIQHLNDAMANMGMFNMKLSIGIVSALGVFVIIDEIRWYKINKRIKKLELANGLKNS